MTTHHDIRDPLFADPAETGPRAGRVLIVEDDPPTRHLIEQSVRRAGFAVVTTDSGTAALQLLRREPSIRVVLLDLEMPGFSGWEFRRAQRADRRLAAVPTVVITATALEKIVDDELRAADYVLKPVSPDYLVSVVAKYCERQR